MKSIMSRNIVKILKSNTYKDFDFIVNDLPKELKKRGIDITVKLGGHDLTRIMFIQNLKDGTERDITPVIEKVLADKEMYNPSKNTELAI